MQCWMMEDAVNDTVECAVDVDTFVVLARDYLRHHPLYHLSGNLASRLIEHIRKVIFG